MSSTRDALLLDARAAAAAERERLGLGVDAIGDVFALIQDQDIAVVRKPMGEDGPDGFHARQGDLAVVAVNASKRRERQRFTAAHAYGHHVLHQDRVLIVDTDVFAGNDPREAQANHFAVHFLLPAEGVARALRRLGHDEVGVRPLELGPREVVHIARSFGTSCEATLWHLLNLGHLRRERCDALRGERPDLWARRLGHVVDEPEDRSLVLPPDYVRRALDAYQAERVSLARLAELLRLDETQAEHLAIKAGAAPRAPAPEDVLGDARGA